VSDWGRGEKETGAQRERDMGTVGGNQTTMKEEGNWRESRARYENGKGEEDKGHGEIQGVV